MARALTTLLGLVLLSALLLTPSLAVMPVNGPAPAPAAVGAQAPNAPVPPVVPAKPEVTIFFGRVMDASGTVVDGVQVQHATMAIFIRADSADAPGKVPDDKAQQAANMKTMADNLENQYKQKNLPVPPPVADQVSKLRAYANELLHWREVDKTIASDDAAPIPISGIERVPLTEVSDGTRLHVFVRAEKPQQAGTPPDQGQLVRDAVETTAANTPLLIRQAGNTTGHDVFFELVGDVTVVDPLTINVGPLPNGTAATTDTKGVTIRLDVPEHIGLIQRITQQVSDLYAGERFTARVKLNGPLDIAGVDHFTVFINVEPTTAYDNDTDLAFVRPVGPPVHGPGVEGAQGPPTEPADN